MPEKLGKIVISPSEREKYFLLWGRGGGIYDIFKKKAKAYLCEKKSYASATDLTVRKRKERIPRRILLELGTKKEEKRDAKSGVYRRGRGAGFLYVSCEIRGREHKNEEEQQYTRHKGTKQPQGPDEEERHGSFREKELTGSQQK